MSKKDEERCMQILFDACIGNGDHKVEFDNTNGVVMEIARSFRANPNANTFPDFFFKGGVVEHFLVGTSEERKGGSRFKRDEFFAEKEAELYREEVTAEWSNRHSVSGELQVATITQTDEGFSYEYFLQSLKRNWDSHIHSLEAGEKDYGKVAFLMEQQTPKLSIYKDNKFIGLYSLYKDRNALSIISEYSREVDYAIYITINAIEAIDLRKIDELLAKAEVFEDVRGGRYVRVHQNLFFTR